MDDLIATSEKYYKRLFRAAIIMPIVATILVTLLGWMLYSVSMIFGYKLAPTEGLWYCKELGFEVNFDCESEHIMTDASGAQYLFSCHAKSHVVEIYTIADTVPIEENGKARYWYEYGELVYEFTYVSLKGDRYIIQDKDGSKYVFVRK